MKPRDFFIYSKKQEENLLLADSIKKVLLAHGFRYQLNDQSLILVLGGDGTLLKAIHENNGKGQYLLLNTGHLGFYADYESYEQKTFLNDILTKEPTSEQFPLFDLYCGDKHFLFANDVAIQTLKTCFMRVYVNDELLTDSRNNGIVVSTPVGTTGYLTSLGSPVVIAKEDIYQFSLLAPCYNRMCPNTISKAILSGKDKLRIHITRGNVTTLIDGKEQKYLFAKDFTFTHASSESITLLHLRDNTYIKRLRKNISGKEN